MPGRRAQRAFPAKLFLEPATARQARRTKARGRSITAGARLVRAACRRFGSPLAGVRSKGASVLVRLDADAALLLAGARAILFHADLELAPDLLAASRRERAAAQVGQAGLQQAVALRAQSRRQLGRLR